MIIEDEIEDNQVGDIPTTSTDTNTDAEEGPPLELLQSTENDHLEDIPTIQEDLELETEENPLLEPTFGLADLADTNFKYWEAENYDPDPDEPRVRMSSNPNVPPRSTSVEISPELAERLTYWNLTEQTLTYDELEIVIQALQQYEDVFAKDEYDLGRFPSWEHTVDTGDHPPIRAKPRPLSQEKQKCLREILDNLSRTHMIRPSRSVWASGIVMVRKKDGSWRMCMDFRPINRIATCCQFPLPRINDLFMSLRGSMYFSALDLAKGFHQIPLAEDSKAKLAFVTPLGQWEWETTPMGLHSAPAAFQAAMQQTLAGLQHCTLVYIDDIIIFTIEIVSNEVPRIHEFVLPITTKESVLSKRIIKTVSLTSASGSANRAIGSMPLYKQLKKSNPKFNTFNFRVMQYREFF